MPQTQADPSAIPEKQWRKNHSGKGHKIKKNSMKTEEGTYEYLACLTCRACYLVSFKEKKKC